jgi:hypothetical protein
MNTSSPKGASLVIAIHPELGFTSYMAITTLQQIIDERISFLKEQINPENKIQLSKTFQLQIDAIRSLIILKKLAPIILQKEILLKDRKDVHESEKLFCRA